MTLEKKRKKERKRKSGGKFICELTRLCLIAIERQKRNIHTNKKKRRKITLETQTPRMNIFHFFFLPFFSILFFFFTGNYSLYENYSFYDNYLALLVTTQLEVLATLQGTLVLDLADGALKTKNNLLGSLGLK